MRLVSSLSLLLLPLHTDDAEPSFFSLSLILSKIFKRSTAFIFIPGLILCAIESVPNEVSVERVIAVNIIFNLSKDIMFLARTKDTKSFATTQTHHRHR